VTHRYPIKKQAASIFELIFGLDPEAQELQLCLNNLASVTIWTIAVAFIDLKTVKIPSLKP
jgi:hypothetical protein